MRTIIVGDVHGCREELEALLDRVAFASGDRLIFVGDLVARGPDSLGVLDVARRTGAIIVRGNHEQRLLDLRRSHAAWVKGEPAPRPDGRMHRALARALRPVDWTLFETSPLFVELPDHGACIVHAGLAPGVALEAQSPGTLMQIRTVDSVLWGERHEGPPQVVFGHNAAPGLQIHRWATGLDTGCVYGGALTAMVLAHGEHVPHDAAARREVLVSEPARRIWFAAPRAATQANRSTSGHR